LSFDPCEFTLHTAVNAENNDCSKKHVCFLQHTITIENLHTQMYQNLKLTLFFLEDLGGMILIVSTKKKTYQIIFLKKINKSPYIHVVPIPLNV
jgi:hypothetical protein